MRNGGRHCCQPPLRRDLDTAGVPSVRALANPRRPDPGSPAQASASQSPAASPSRSPSPVRRFQSEDRPLLPGSALAVRRDPKVAPFRSGCPSGACSLVRSEEPSSPLPPTGRGVGNLAIASDPPSPVHAALLGVTTPGCRPKPLPRKRSFVRPPWRTITSSGASCLPCSGNPSAALGEPGAPAACRNQIQRLPAEIGFFVPLPVGAFRLRLAGAAAPDHRCKMTLNPIRAKRIRQRRACGKRGYGG